ncbi:hypothetical protein CPC08DRAFT_815668 [Agrocybe pediades]|nr:hypothetical protein CPC08DRAFT_815668 [Agrocybe pediades]
MNASDTNLSTVSDEHPGSPNLSSVWTCSSDTSKVRTGRQPPSFPIDLSIPPEQRYTRICKEYHEELKELVDLYRDVLKSSPFPRVFKFLGKRLLRKVFSEEETRELKGISKASGLPYHVVVAFNTFLDSFSGCISGGAHTGSSMIHFRNLDWEMDNLRDLIIRVEYVLEGKVIARAVTYAGYIGVLTGVREGLSLSMNYRAAMQTESSPWRNRLHYCKVTLGRRPSIASQLRSILLSPEPPPALGELAAKFKTMSASPCYITFCTPSSVLVIEKSLESAISHTSDKFFAVTNHDVATEKWSKRRWQALVGVEASKEVREIMNDSMERKECMHNFWLANGGEQASIEDVKTWLRTRPVRNEDTHFACIMDPSVQGGGLVWVEMYFKKFVFKF